MNSKIIELIDETKNAEKPQFFRNTTQPKITIVGAGVIGLTTSIILARAGNRARVYYNQPMERTTSFAAAAFWFPVLVGNDPRILGMAAESLGVFAELAKNPKTGVRPIRLRVCYTDSFAADLSWRAAVPTTGVPQSELPNGCVCGFDANVYRMQMEIYLPYLMSKAKALGVEFEQQNVTDLASLPGDVIVNCSGIHARHLVDDMEVEPIRGQVALVSKPQISPAIYPYDVLIVEGPVAGGKERLDYIVLRDNDALLGGTADRGDWQLTPRRDQRDEILANCAAIMPELKSSFVLSERVGLRPGRSSLRLAAEYKKGSSPLIHAYGHGGAGVTLSWGTGAWVDSMVAMILFDLNAWSYRAKAA